MVVETRRMRRLREACSVARAPDQGVPVSERKDRVVGSQLVEGRGDELGADQALFFAVCDIGLELLDGLVCRRAERPRVCGVGLCAAAAAGP